MAKNLILLKFRNMTDINANLLQFFDKMSASFARSATLAKQGKLVSANANTSGSAVKGETIPKHCPSDLAGELHKTIIRKFDKRKVCSSFKDNI